MSTPVLHVLAGPNGSGKSTFVRTVLGPTLGLPFVNADEIAAERWPGSQVEHAYEASQVAAAVRHNLLTAGASFVTETVFSHASKVDLIRAATTAGYIVRLHVMLIPVEVAMARVEHRVEQGGHAVPASKIRERYERLWPLVVEALRLAHRTEFYDNSRARSPFVLVARYERNRPIGNPTWPRWTPAPLLLLDT